MTAGDANGRGGEQLQPIAGTVFQQSTSTAAATPPTVSVGSDAGLPYVIDVAMAIPIELEHRGGPGYRRSDWPHWDALGAGCTVRDRVLIDESLTPISVSTANCVLTGGRWRSPYDQVVVTDPTVLEIDHVVSLDEAYDSGGWAWSADVRRQYANDLTDPDHLVAVTSESNRAKGAKDPSNWLPVTADVCRYLSSWVAIKTRWSLTMDRSEAGRVKNVLTARCPGLRAAPVVPRPQAVR